MTDTSISEVFRQDLKQCLICGDYKIDTRRRFKNALNCWFCIDCYLPGQCKVKCRDCKTPIELTKDYTGNFKTRCWLCYLGRIRTNTTRI
jgi:hypothetical protein